MGRAIILTVMGIALCAGVVTVVVALEVYNRLADVPFTAANVAGNRIFGAIAAIVPTLALLVWRRRARGGAAGARDWTVSVVPFLVAIGLAGGGWFAAKIIREHQRDVASNSDTLCRDALGWQAARASLDACTPTARRCIARFNEFQAQPSRGTSAATSVSADLPSDPQRRAQLLCVRDLLHVGPGVAR